MIKKRVIIVSEYNAISVSLAERFLSNFFSVKVVCVKKVLWQEHASYLLPNGFFSLDSFNESLLFRTDFSIFVSCFYDNLFSYKKEEIFSNEKRRLFWFLSRVVSEKGKFVILPYRVYENVGFGLVEIYNKNINLQQERNLYLCFVDDIFGPRVILSSRSEVSSFMLPLFAEKKSFFSSGSAGSRICLLGDFSRRFVDFVLEAENLRERRILFSGKSFNKDLLIDILKEQKTDFLSNLRKIIVPPKSAIFELEIKLKERLDSKKVVETILWFTKNKNDLFFDKGRDDLVVEKKRVSDFDKYRMFFNRARFLFKNFLPFIENFLSKIAVIKTPKIKIKFRFNKKIGIETKFHFPKHFKFRFPSYILKAAVYFLFFVLVFPILPIVLTTVSIYFGYKSLLGFNLSGAVSFVRLSEAISYPLSENYYNLSKFPVIGNYYLFLGDSLSVINNLSRVFNSGVSLAKNITFLYEHSLKGQELDLPTLSRTLFLDFNSLYFRVSLLEGSLEDLEEKYTFIKPLSDRLNFSRYRQQIYSAREVSLLLPEVLGSKEERRYLVLFQNNMELRPTGGFIGSFAIVSFKKGALTNFEVYDVYTADGQLRGYVESPLPIKTHLNQPSWYLRDSNWDPDFSVSAKRAEWFLDKSMKIEVNGVFSFDTTFVRDLVSVVGQLNIVDYNKTINDKIFYDVVQYEVERDFFPGSRQKSNFLTALSKSLLFEMRNAGPSTLISFLPVFYRNLNERHLQLFFNDEVVQEKVAFLGWDGALKQPQCFSENCFEDIVAVVESNLGVNKVNYFVLRNVNLNVEIGDFLKREIEINFENKAPIVLNDKGRYKNYIRLFVSASSVVERVAIEDNGKSVDIVPDQGYIRGMKEIGFLVEVPPESNRKIVVAWKEEAPFDLYKNGEYRLFFRKQAGISSFPFRLSLKFPSGFKVASDNLRLTRDGYFVYNQPLLRKDFLDRFYW